MGLRILVVDDEPSILESMEMYLGEKGYEVSCARTAAEALRKSISFDPDVVILDVKLPDGDGLDLLCRLKGIREGIGVIVVTAFHDMETAVKAIKLGASEYIPKPIDVEDLEGAIKRIARISRSFKESGDLRLVSPGSFDESIIVGKSRAMKEVFKAIGRLSESRVTVLIEGETGTGKELVARAIHYYSPYRDQPFIPINCAAIVGTLLESELFGHEKGAFTGAVSTKKGKFELAGSGTIFLDEVGEIPLELQAKLLRFLQEREFHRVGGERLIRSNARVIAATNRSLEEMVRSGLFREDLYYRLSVATIRVPPLRERLSDIPLLVEHIICKVNRNLGLDIKGVEKGALERMMKYCWPGNVRELENVITKAALSTDGGVILEEDVDRLLSGCGKEDYLDQVDMSLEEVERRHILRVLKYTGWHYGRACKILGISRPTLRKKMKRYGIEKVRGEVPPSM